MATCNCRGGPTCCKVVAHRASLIPWPWPGSSYDGPIITGLTASDDTPPRGLPAYTPTEPQPTRCGGTEA